MTKPKSSKIDRLFRFDMYPADWLIDTGDLTTDEQGMFLVIVLMIYAKRGPIPNDPGELSRKFNDCSIRKARSLISSLVRKEKLKLSADFLSQKRAETELKGKRTHLETSMKGGRTSAENKLRNKENNDLPGTKGTKSVGTPSHLNPSASQQQKKIDQDQGKKPSKQPKIPRMDLLNFNVRDLMDEDGFQDARVFASVMGQTVDDLAISYSNAVKNGDMDPPRDANKAFPAWIESLAKRKQNRRSR